MITKTQKAEAASLRAQAAAADQRVADSIQNSDTDGFVSQWAGGLTAREYRLQAEIVEAGGVATFFTEYLKDLATGEKAQAKQIKTKYGWAWAFMDETGEFTGQFISAGIKDSTMAKKGYAVERDYFAAPAKATIKGETATSCRVGIAPADGSLKYDGCCGPGDQTDNDEAKGGGD